MSTRQGVRPRILIRKDRSVPFFPWFFTVEHEPRREDAYDYGSLETFEAAMAAAWDLLCRSSVCPLCAGTEMTRVNDGFLVCSDGCGEMLEPTELVSEATDETKRAYCQRNFGTDGYPGE